MDNTKISVSRILQLQVPIAWHEAVAVAQGVAQCGVTHDDPPGLDTCFLTLTGQVEVAGGSHHPFDGDLSVHVLSLILDRDRAPKELLALVTRYQEHSSGVSGDFAGDLAFFARPDTTSEIRTVASRAIAKDHEAETQAELDRLRHVAAPPPVASPAPASRHRIWPWAIAIGSVAAVAVLAVFFRGLPLDAAANETPAQPTAISRITSSLDTLVDAGLVSLGLTTAAAAPAATAAAPVPRKPAPARSRRPQLVVRGAEPALVEPPSAPPDANAPADAPPMETPAQTGDDSPSGVDSGLEPPMLVRPQLRTDSSSSEYDDASTYLELVVNEFGRVDRVQLHSPNSSVHDRMLVSAAKAWVFRPALRNGQPIKYVMRVPITSEARQ